jgi:PKD repeat protein
MDRRTGLVVWAIASSFVLLSCGDQAPNLRPTAAITTPGQDTTVAVDAPVDFQGSANDADGTVASHAWAFGDGGTGSVADPGPHPYGTQGTYTVTYQVTDDGGAASIPDTVLVTALPGPVATIASPGRDTTVTLADPITFAGAASDPDGAVASHHWEFGDGSVATVEDPGAHLYAARGTYTVTYRVTDDDGVTSRPDTVTVEVNEPPVARIDTPGRDTTARWPYALDFSGTAGDADGTVTEHRWDFGDGNTAEDADPGPYAYADPGTYTVRYQSVDDDGAVSEPAEVVVTVEAYGIAPEPGNWFGWPAFGLSFIVDPQGTAITSVTFIFEQWTCGGDPLPVRVAAGNPSGWPITDAAFAITSAFPEYDIVMTIEGSFLSNTTAAGAWWATRSDTTCAGHWTTERTSPSIAVFVTPDFSRTIGIVGFGWLPGRQVTIAIDRAADGTIDLLATTRAGWDGAARLQSPALSNLAEGDSVGMHDAVWAVGYVVRYVTLESVDAATDVVSGAAREGTAVRVTIANPVSSIEGPYLDVAADATGHWRADFTGIYDIVADTHLSVSAGCLGISGGLRCGGATGLQWPP